MYDCKQNLEKESLLSLVSLYHRFGLIKKAKTAILYLSANLGPRLFGLTKLSDGLLLKDIKHNHVPIIPKCCLYISSLVIIKALSPLVAQSFSYLEPHLSITKFGKWESDTSRMIQGNVYSK